MREREEKEEEGGERTCRGEEKEEGGGIYCCEFTVAPAGSTLYGITFTENISPLPHSVKLIN